jgi:hypothetical protein
MGYQASAQMHESRVAVLVRMREGLKARLVDLAKREHRSLNQQVEFLLEHCLSGEIQSLSNEQQPPKTEPQRKR